MVASTRLTPASNERLGSSSEASSNVKTFQGRRSHKKSRKGCIECKSRHIRCDERQPSCANCEIAERTCVYPPPKVGNQKRRSNQGASKKKRNPKTAVAATPSAESGLNGRVNADRLGSEDAELRQPQVSSLPLRLEVQDESSLPPDQSLRLLRLSQDDSPFVTITDTAFNQNPGSGAETPISGFLPGLSTEPDAVSNAAFTLPHMILLRHADTVPNYTGHNRSIVDIAIRHAVKSPYLMDEVLAFTALHLTHVYPGSSSCLAQLATEFQTRALASFARLTEHVSVDDEATAVPRFLFSSILGRHYLAETLAHHRSDLHLFINRIAECFSLNRGIKAVTPPAREFLLGTELQPFLSPILDAQSKIVSPGSECNPLSRLIDISDLDEASLEVGRRTIQLLQHSFDIARHLDEEQFPQAAITFSVHVESGFVELLRKHQPEALIILAFYGVLLHRCRTFWAFSDGGAYMVGAISRYLGAHWQEALQWPQSVVKTQP